MRLDANPSLESSSSNSVRCPEPGGLDFDELYRTYGPRIRSLAVSRITDHHLAEDVVQETLFRVYRYQSKLDPSRPLWPWLSRIAANVCVDVLRGTRSPSEELHPQFEELDRSSPDSSDPEGLYMISEHCRTIMDALARLHPRYKRVLILKYKEGWTYKQIASMEGSSLDALQSVLKRARQSFRETYSALARDRRIPSVLIPVFMGQVFVRTRNKIRDFGRRVAQTINDAGYALSIRGGMLGGKVEPVIAAGAVIAIALTGITSTGVSSAEIRVNPVSPEEQIIPVQQQFAASSADNSPNQLVSTVPAVVETVDHQTEDLGLDPTREETPEDATITSMAVSPNYENDHTVYAAGGRLLFVTRDGGASWVLLPAIGLLNSSTLMLPPTYPQDDRIFSASLTGLQESTDGGRTFQPLVVLPLWGTGAAISPNFGRGNSQILLSTATGIMEYDRELNSLRPNPLPLPLDGWLNSFSILPSSTDPTVLVSMFRRQQYGQYVYSETFPYRCESVVCQKVESYNGLGTPFFRYSQRIAEDGTVYLVAPSTLYVSSDRGQNFRKLTVPTSTDGFPVCCNDLAVVPLTSSTSSMLIGASWDENGVYRSMDGGISWGASNLALTDHQIPMLLKATPTGRVFAAGWRRGIACSVDEGVTWAPRCPSES